MAALDPTQAPEADEDGNVPAVPRATLKILKGQDNGDEDEDDSYLDGLLNGEYSDEDDSEDEEANGGPSDPSRSKKARQEAAIKKLIEAAQNDEDSDEEMDEADGLKSKKGKGKASDEDDDEVDEDSEDEDEAGLEEFVICTLDTERVSHCTVSTHGSPLTDWLTMCEELPTTAGHHHRREREGVLRRLGYTRYPPYRQLRRRSL
jgi:FK506-binding nuclear protein